MSKKVTIVEEDIPEPVEETRDEIIEQVNIPPEPTRLSAYLLRSKR